MFISIYLSIRSSSYLSQSDSYICMYVYVHKYINTYICMYVRIYVHTVTYTTDFIRDVTWRSAKAMNDREKWRERVRNIHAGGTTWWWWWWYIYIYTHNELSTLVSDSRKCKRTKFDTYALIPKLMFSQRVGLGVCHQPDVKVLFTNPSARAGYDTRSIFKRSLTGFN